MTTLHMNELTEGIRQLILKSRNATLTGVTLVGSAKIQGLIDEIDGLCVKIEALSEHPSRYSLADGMVNEKPAQTHTENRLRRKNDRTTMNMNTATDG